MEKQIVEWLTANWPNLIVALIFARVYLRLSHHMELVEKINRRVAVLREVCAEQHKDQARRIFQEDEK